MNVDNQRITFDDFEEVQIYLTSARRVAEGKGDPDDQELIEKATQLLVGDKGSILDPLLLTVAAIYRGALEMMNAFDEDPKVFAVLDSSGCPTGHAFFQLEEAQRQAEIHGEASINALIIFGVAQEEDDDGDDDEDYEDDTYEDEDENPGRN